MNCHNLVQIALITFVVAETLMSSGCASIVSGQNQVISVDTPGCEGAKCELTNDKGKWYVTQTPGTTIVNRSYNNLQVVCNKEGFPTATTSIPSTTKGMAFGNILLGGIIGAGVDVNSGAAYDYPQSISVPINCKASSPIGDSTRNSFSKPKLGLHVKDVSASGVKSLPATSPAKGVLVVGVMDKSPAQLAGIKEGDVILRANGAEVADSNALATIVSGLRSGSTLELRVFSEGHEVDLRIDIGSSTEF